jgi:hypothetical protein
LSATQTHSKNIKDEAGRPIYMIREEKIERSHHYREPDRYSGANLKHILTGPLPIYKNVRRKYITAKTLLLIETFI